MKVLKKPEFQERCTKASFKRTLTKTLVYRVLSTAATFAMGLWIWHEVHAAIKLAGADFVLDSLIYLGHEFGWQIFGD